MTDVVAVYSDGGCIGPNPSQIGGVWACCGVDAEGKRRWEKSGILVPGGLGLGAITNNQSEFWGLLLALEHQPDGWSGQVFSDSKVTLGRFFWRYAMNGIPWHWEQRMNLVVARLGVLKPTLLDGHPTLGQLAAGRGKRGQPVSVHNKWCDEECGRIAQQHRGGS